MQDVQHLSMKILQNSSVQVTSPLQGGTETSNELYEMNDGFVSSFQISLVPALAVLAVCSSPAVLGSGCRRGSVPCIAKAEQSKLHELHRKSLLCPGSHRA